MTGFSPKTRKLICERALYRCERCSANNPTDAHHRRARGLGGSKDPLTNTAANGVFICRPCHSDIESNRTRALMDGWLLRQGQDPRDIPVLYRGTTWSFLTEDGTVRPA